MRLLLSPSQQPLEHKEQSCSKNRKKQCASLSLELRGLVPCSEEASGPTPELKCVLVVRSGALGHLRS